MDQQQAALYQRIQAFAIDQPGAQVRFSQRLARENAWSAEYTQRVIAEYKKFAFLAVVAGHPVSPSDAVDQAWHLHLTYTRSYWDQFCAQVLETPLHHEPGQGGSAEKAKFADWYQQTLTSYQRFFGEPPRDIWPSPYLHFGQPQKFVRLDTAAHWVIPKLLLPKPAIALPLMLVALAIAGCTPLLSTEISNPLNWRGSEFLEFYVLLGVPTLLLAFGLRAWLRQPVKVADASAISLSAYELAYLAASEQRVIDTAVASLVQRRYITANPNERSLSQQISLLEGSSALEIAIQGAAIANNTIDQVRTNQQVNAAVQEICDRLETQGLLLSQSQAQRLRWVPSLLVLSLLGLGICKIGIGITRHKPVGLLLLLCGLVVIWGISLWQAERLTRSGDRLLADFRKKYATVTAVTLTDPQELAIAFALFGPSILTGNSTETLRQLFTPGYSASLTRRSDSNNSDSSSCGSSCGSSCSGGSDSSGCGSSCGSSCGGGCGGCSG